MPKDIMGQKCGRGLGRSGNWGDDILFTLHPEAPYFGHRGYEQKGTREIWMPISSGFLPRVCFLGFTSLHILPPLLILRGNGNTT